MWISVRIIAHIKQHTFNRVEIALQMYACAFNAQSHKKRAEFFP